MKSLSFHPDDWPTELLQEGWKYLFEYYETFSNHDERVLVDKKKDAELENLMSAWSEILVSLKFCCASVKSYLLPLVF